MIRVKVRPNALLTVAGFYRALPAVTTLDQLPGEALLNGASLPVRDDFRRFGLAAFSEGSLFVALFLRRPTK